MPITLPKQNTYVLAVIFGFLAAIFAGLETPLSKSFMTGSSPLMTLAFMNLGAGLGFVLVTIFARKSPKIMDPNRHLRKNDIWYLIGTIATYVIGNSFLYTGLSMSSAVSVSLLKTFETVVTAVVALIFFKEAITKRLWIGIALITLGCISILLNDISSASADLGCLLVFIAVLLFGFAFNFGRKLSERNPAEFSLVVRMGIGLITLVIAFASGESLPLYTIIIPMLICGFITLGLKLFFLTSAQRHLGAAKAGAINGVAPVFAIIGSFIILHETPSITLLAAILLLAPGLYFSITRHKQETKEVYVDREEGESPLLAMMSDSAKQEARNYLSSFGFLLMAMVYILAMFSSLSASDSAAAFSSFEIHMVQPCMIAGAMLILVSIGLLVLRHRVLHAVTFMFFAAMLFLTALAGNNTLITNISACFLLILAMIILLSNDRYKYIFALINLFCGIVGALGCCHLEGGFAVLMLVISGALALFLIYLAIACSTQKIALPLTRMLSSDSTVRLNKAGPMLGFLFAAMYISLWLLKEIFSEAADLDSLIQTVSLVFVAMMILIAVLLFIIGKMQFTPVMFAAMGMVFWLDMYATGPMEYGVGLILILTGIFAVLSRFPRFLTALFLIGCGFCNIMLYYAESQGLGSMPVIILFEAICVLLALYIAFANMSARPKLPML